MPVPTPRLNGASPGPAPPGPAAPANGTPPVDYAEFVDRQLRWTRGRLRWVELAAGLVSVLAAVGTYLLAMAVLDHWIVPGGLGYLGRTLSWFGLLLLVGALAWWRIGALVWRAIHPLHAAAAIEHAQPELKNSLINFLMLRGERGQLSPAIYQAIEQRAAADVSQVPLERAIDRTALIRVGYALLVVVALGCVYKLLSPKDPLRSLARVMLPWSTIERPTRVAIFEVEPGTTEVFHGDSLVVSAVIRGLRRGEEARLVYSTADGQVTNRELPLDLPPGSYRHRVTLPPGGSGLQQDVSYYLAAGDARTREYKLRVITAPALLVDRVEYAYPAYTGLSPRIVERQGDLVALEGTQVTLWARANQPPRTAHVDFLGDGQNDLAMQVDGLGAKVAFQLRRNPEGQPEYPTYQLRFTTAEGRGGPAPILHRIEVLTDQPPQVEFVEPASDPSPLARNGAVSLVIKALDPDFRLEEVGVWVQRDGATLWSETLLSSAHAGEFRRAVTLDARRLDLEPGQRLECYAYALDGRLPEPNRTEIGPVTLEVIDPVSEAERKQQLAEAAEKEKSPDRPGAERLARRPPAGERALGEPSARESAAAERPSQPPAPADSPAQRAPPTVGEPPPPGEPQPSATETERVDPETQPGDAFERILEHQADEVPEPTPDESGSGEGGGQGSSGDKRDRRPSDQDRASDDEGNDEASDNAGAEGESAPEPGAAEKSPNDRRPSTDRREPRAGDDAGDAAENAAGQDQADSAAEGEEPGETGERGGEERRRQPSPSQEAGDEPGDESAEGEPGSSAAPGQNLPGGDPDQAGAGDQPQGPGEASGGSADRDAGESGGEPGGESSAGGAGEGEGEESATGEAGSSGSEPASDGSDGRNGAEGGDSAGAEGDASEPGTDGGQTDRGKGPRDGARGRGRRTGAEEPGAADDAAAPEGEAADGEAPEGDAADGGAGERPSADAPAQTGERRAERPAGRGSRPQDTPPNAGAGAADNPEATGGDASGAEEDPGSDGNETPGDEPESGVGGAEGSRAGGGNPQAGHEGSPAAENQPQSREPQSEAPTQPSEQDSGEPSSPSNQGNRASDSSGSEGGDRSGGGDQGGGQQADAPGAGASGGNSPADSGGGAAPGEGTGPTGTGGGAGAEGTSDDGQGERRQGEGGSGSGGGPREGAGDSSGDSAPPGSGGGSSDSSAETAPADGSSPAAGGGSTSSSGARGPGGRSNPAGGGLPGDQRGAPEGSLLGSGGAPSGDEPPDRQEQTTAADQANLDYARRATDLVLEYLKDQVASGEPDQELLDKLGWTPDDMARFLRRWEELKRQAAQEGPAGDEARRRLERALQGLGLRRRGMQLEAGADQEQTEQIRETRRAGPPPEYREQFRAYTEETADTTPADEP